MTIQHALLGEQELIACAQQGDTRAYGELVNRHREGVVRVVYRMCGDPILAEDAAQEAFLRAWQRLDRYKPQHPFRAWVFRIATNAALDALRAEKPAEALENVEQRAAADSETEALVEQRQRAGRVQRAVMALPAPSRTVLVLREWGQLSYSEIAEALAIPMGTVMSRLNAARGQLRQALAEMMEAG